MILEILGKITSELLLSLYPVFVKFINLPIGIQMWCIFLHKLRKITVNLR